MILLHKLNDDEFILNSDHIETIEERPDTVLSLSNEKKYIVKETAAEVVAKVMEFRQKLFSQFAE